MTAYCRRKVCALPEEAKAETEIKFTKMGKTIKLVVKAENMQLHECTDGFWLYDDTRGMNLAMKAKSEQDAFIDALEYYQKRLLSVESQYNDLKAKVDAFVSLFPNED